MTTTAYPLGHPENPRTRIAPLDAVLLAQAVHNEDPAAQVAILANSDPYSVCAQLAGFLLATLRQYEVDIDDRLMVWRAVTAAQVGEVSA